MGKWRLTIKIGRVWQLGKSRELTEFSDELYLTLKAYDNRIKSLGEDVESEWTKLLESLAEEPFEEYDDFDEWLERFYDFCDYYKIWVDIHN